MDYLENIKKELDNEPVYNGKYLKAKIKSYNGKINTKEGSKWRFPVYLFISSFDSFCFRTGKKLLFSSGFRRM